jgi:Glycolipid transfer protein (GLTP)
MGTSFTLVRSDVGGNIDRLAKRNSENPIAYSYNIFQIIEAEVREEAHTGSSSCTKGLLWLKRAMEFLVGILQELNTHRDVSMNEAVSRAYAATLQPFHGWIVGSTFTLAFKFVPSREAFFEKLGIDENAEDHFTGMKLFSEEFGSILREIHDFLDSRGLNDPSTV